MVDGGGRGRVGGGGGGQNVTQGRPGSKGRLRCVFRWVGWGVEAQKGQVRRRGGWGGWGMLTSRAK